ncbi:MAG: hypothetical protein WAW86_05360 [Gammaproteobacteria bacterium]
MAATMPLYNLLDIDLDNLTTQERSFVDMILCVSLCEEFRHQILAQYKGYFNSIKENAEKERSMLEQNIIGCILNDILSTNEYSLSGVAYYTNTPEEILMDVSTGSNLNPTFNLSRKLIDLHRTVKPQLYVDLLRKILDQKSDE